MKYSFLLFTFILVCCNAQKTTSQNSTATDNQTNNDAYSLILQSSHGGYSKPSIEVIKEPEALRKFYSYINRTRRPGFAVPKIDFEKETVLVLCMGEKSYSGYAIELDKIEEKRDQQLIWVKETAPNPTDKVLTVITQPFAIYKIENTQKDLTFKKSAGNR